MVFTEEARGGGLQIDERHRLSSDALRHACSMDTVHRTLVTTNTFLDYEEMNMIRKGPFTYCILGKLVAFHILDVATIVSYSQGQPKPALPPFC